MDFKNYLNQLSKTRDSSCSSEPTQQQKRSCHAAGGSVSDNRREAKKLERMGRDGDTQLVHVNRQEERMLKNAGGRGSINPKTGLREYMFKECSIHPGEDVKNCPRCNENHHPNNNNFKLNNDDYELNDDDYELSGDEESDKKTILGCVPTVAKNFLNDIYNNWKNAWKKEQITKAQNKIKKVDDNLLFQTMCNDYPFSKRELNKIHEDPDIGNAEGDVFPRAGLSYREYNKDGANLKRVNRTPYEKGSSEDSKSSDAEYPLQKINSLLKRQKKVAIGDDKFDSQNNNEHVVQIKKNPHIINEYGIKDRNLERTLLSNQSGDKLYQKGRPDAVINFQSPSLKVYSVDPQKTIAKHNKRKNLYEQNNKDSV